MNPHDIGSRIKGVTALTPAVITAAAGNDNTELNGIVVNRLLAGRGLAKSAKLIIQFVTSLTADKTLTITANAQDGAASNLSDAADYAAVRASYDVSSAAPPTAVTLSSGNFPATAVKTGAASGVSGQVEIDFDLSAAKQYIRCQVTFDLSHSGTDTVAYSAVWVFGGQDVLPAT
jgi:hypothetical protein